MPPKQHARLSASSSERWQNCTGSVRMSEGLPDTDTIYKQEGRAAHALAEWALKMKRPVSTFPDETIDIPSEDGNVVRWPVTDEMVEHVGLYVRVVREKIADYESQGYTVELHIEQKLNLSLLQPPEEMFGTGDVVLVLKSPKGDANGLHAFDLKYGAGVVVNVIDNSQLHYYICGALLVEMAREVFSQSSAFTAELGESMLDAALRAFPAIAATIVQPRARHVDGPVRTLWVDPPAVKQFATRLMEKARETQDPNAPLTPGTWCHFCPAAGFCPALAQRNNLIAVDEFGVGPLSLSETASVSIPDPAHVSVEEAADYLSKGELLVTWLAAIRARIEQELARGNTVPGWKLVNKRATRLWNGDPIEALHLMGFKDAEIFEPKVVRSVAQLEKITGRHRIPELLITKSSPGYKLVSETDPRPAILLSPADDFPALPPGDAATNDEPE